MMMTSLYKKALDIYFQLKPHQTSDWERYWSNRKSGKDWHGEQINWIDGYWNSRNHPHRKLLVDSILEYNPGTILEIGCASAPNIALINEKLPNANIVGIDINEEAIRRARYELSFQPNIHFYHMSMDKIGFGDGYFDITFTDAVMIYMGRDKIAEVMAQIKRVTTKAVIFLERHLDGVGWQGTYKDGLWYRDYLALARTYFPDSQVRVTKIKGDVWKEWSEYGYLIEVAI
jgi:ubiquinone/menaquinone biosynthesis C-methylase UbiE